MKRILPIPTRHDDVRTGAAKRRRGNVAVFTALMLVPITIALGVGYDFTVAQSRRDRLVSMADTAALAAVTPAMMGKSASQSQQTAQTLFANEIATVPGIAYSPSAISVSAADTATGTALTRNVTVNFSAASANAFASILGMSTFPINGTSIATSSAAPNIDFYVMLDNSPSMEIAATTAGINTMVANTGPQGGCAFGCHEQNPAADYLGNPPGEDNYTLARALGVPLRIDLVNQAVQNLMTIAQNTETGNDASYRAAIYTMNTGVNTLQELTNNLDTAKSSAANIAALEVYQNNYLTQTNHNQDEDTAIDTALSTLNSAMPAPGNGTKNSTDSPQEVLFIVSDGLNDTLVSGTRVYKPVGTALSTNWCTAIKNRGIRIAFLYTTYNPLPTNSWYNQYVSPVQANIATAAQKCASPGLYYQVSTDGDISAALAALFQRAVATARLSK